MSNAELILGGLKLLVFGMGMVFVFLVVMIIAMNLMQKILAPFAAAFEPAPKAPASRRRRPAGMTHSWRRSPRRLWRWFATNNLPQV